MLQPALFAALVYVALHLTLLPSTPGGDSGELLAESCLQGTPHPPGYPLFTMLSHLAMKVPVPRVYLASNSWALELDYKPTPAWRVNHLCCVFGALTACLLLSSTRELWRAILPSPSASTYNSPILSVGALLFILSPLVWEYSLSAEVFALNNLLCAALTWLTCSVLRLCYRQEERQLFSPLASLTPRIVAGAFCSGLALANQHTCILLLVVLVPTVAFASFPTLRRSGTLLVTYALASAAFLLAFSSYLYLYWAAQRPTPGSWGDLTSLQGVVRHVTRAEYGSFQLGVGGRSSEGATERMWLYLKHSSTESYHCGLLLAAVGLFVSFRWGGTGTGTGAGKAEKRGAAVAAAAAGSKKQTSASSIPAASGPAPASVPAPTASLALCLAGAWVFYVVTWHSTLSNLPLNSPMPFGVHARFWMQPNLLLAPLVGVGCKVIASSILPARASSPYFEWAALGLLFATILRSRFPIMDRSSTGWIMHDYANTTLSSLPPKSLLLSHTDLDWNPMRYLRECQGAAAGVTHLSFQIMPYPWFTDKQRKLYPGVSFPELQFDGVATGRETEGNAKLVRSVVLANGALSHTPSFLGFGPSPQTQEQRRAARKATPFPGGIYIDMQSVSELEIGDGGMWRGLLLLPFGSVYRVMAVSNVAESAPLHKASLRQLERMNAAFAPYGGATPHQRILEQYPAGTWEFAVFSVLNDARYQFAMALLTFAMSQQGGISADNFAQLALVADRLYVAAPLLTSVHREAKRGIGGPLFSSPVFDVTKNAALAWMRLEGVLALAVQFREGLLTALESDGGFAVNALLLTKNLLDDVVTPAGLDLVRKDALDHVSSFIQENPQDKDRATFSAFAQKLSQTLNAR